MVRPRSRPRQKPVKVSRSGSYLDHDVGEESELFAALTKPVLDSRFNEQGELVFNEVQQPLIEPGDPSVPHTMLHQVKQLKPNGVPVLCQASNVVAGPFCRDDEI